MISTFQAIKALQREGKLHKKLVSRVRILFIISLIMVGIVIGNIVIGGAHILVAGLLVIAGYFMGMYLFSRMNTVVWNEEEEILKAGKMDVIGYASIALYIVIEIGLRTLLKDVYPTNLATIYILAGVSGMLFGRSLGMMKAMLIASKR